MAESKEFNVEVAEHRGHVLYVWHDPVTQWFYQVDSANPQRVGFELAGLDFESKDASTLGGLSGPGLPRTTELGIE